MKVALVYDWVNKWGGAERVLMALHQIWPHAPLFTSVYNPSTASWAKVFEIRTSFLQNFPFAKRRHELYPWLIPLAFESFNFDEYDLVISVSSGAAKGIITKPGTKHICYCLTPTRYLWSGYEQYFKIRSIRLLTKPIINYLRNWDKIISSRPDFYIAISKTVQQRIKKYYQKESEVIYPPVDIEKFNIEKTNQKKKEKYFLIVSRLVSYKRVDLAIEVFNRLGWNLKIIGEGNQMSKLKKMAKKNIQLLGQLTDEELVVYYQNCEAVIFPQEEDFGLVSVEAQACGKPVIAYKSGGATETILEKKTGEFFYPQTPEALKRVLLNFDSKNYKAEDCRKQAEKFSKQNFIKNFKKKIEEVIK